MNSMNGKSTSKSTEGKPSRAARKSGVDTIHKATTARKSRNGGNVKSSTSDQKEQNQKRSKYSVFFSLTVYYIVIL